MATMAHTYNKLLRLSLLTVFLMLLGMMNASFVQAQQVRVMAKEVPAAAENTCDGLAAQLADCNAKADDMEEEAKKLKDAGGDPAELIARAERVRQQCKELALSCGEAPAAIPGVVTQDAECASLEKEIANCREKEKASTEAGDTVAAAELKVKCDSLEDNHQKNCKSDTPDGSSASEDPCGPLATVDPEAYAQCNSCASLFETAGGELNKQDKSLFGCCMKGVLDAQQIKDGWEDKPALIQECRCKVAPSAMTCLPCMAPQQLDYLKDCAEARIEEATLVAERRELEELSIEGVERAVEEKGAVREDSGLEERVIERVRPTREDGLEWKADPTDFPTCDCPSPQAVAGWEPICGRDPLNIFRWPCIYSSQLEAIDRHIREELIGDKSDVIGFNGIELDEARQVYVFKFMLPAEQCDGIKAQIAGEMPERTLVEREELLRRSDSDQIIIGEGERAELVKKKLAELGKEELAKDEPAKVEELAPPKEVERTECHIEVAACQCSGDQPNEPTPDPKVVGDDNSPIYVCHEGSSFAYNIENPHESVALETPCPQVAFNLSRDPEVIEVDRLIRDCERKGECDGLPEKSPHVLKMMKSWQQGSYADEHMKPNIMALEIPVSGLLQPGPNSQQMATLHVIEPQHLTIEETTQVANVADANAVKVQVKLPADLTSLDPSLALMAQESSSRQLAVVVPYLEMGVGGGACSLQAQSSARQGQVGLVLGLLLLGALLAVRQLRAVRG